jgi:hypothetical protein
MPILGKAFARRGRDFDVEIDVVGEETEDERDFGVSESLMIKTPSDSKYCRKNTDEREGNARVFSPSTYLI